MFCFRLKSQIPDIRTSLEIVKHLQSKKVTHHGFVCLFVFFLGSKNNAESSLPDFPCTCAALCIRTLFLRTVAYVWCSVCLFLDK